MSTRWLLTLAVATCAVAPIPTHAQGVPQVVIENDRLEPKWLETLTGARVNFINRTGHPVHLQFSGDIRQHEVVQIPATGPIWAIFHRPGTHPYVVHVYNRQTRALPGVVSVTTDETHKWESGTCDVVVEGNCIAP
jgi:hypothetical protein